MTDSKDWWPADWGHRRPVHPHELARRRDLPCARWSGRRGQWRPALRPLNSWPDNGNLDKARRLLLPIKQKYGKAISWADPLVFIKQPGARDDGLRTFGLRVRPRRSGRRRTTCTGGRRTSGSTTRAGATPVRSRPAIAVLTSSLAVQMLGLIYVNPEARTVLPAR
ncbi:MAG: peroxidase family protein [Acidimicrobiales bacterium]